MTKYRLKFNLAQVEEDNSFIEHPCMAFDGLVNLEQVTKIVDLGIENATDIFERPNQKDTPS